MNSYFVNYILCTCISAILTTTFARTVSVSIGYSNVDTSTRDRITLELRNPSSSVDVMSIFRSPMKKLITPFEKESGADHDIDSMESEIAIGRLDAPMKFHESIPDFENFSLKREPTANMIPVDIYRMKWSPSSEKLVHRCKSGLILRDRTTTWMESSCITCTCTSARIICERPACPKLPCKEEVPVAGKCCPECPKKICQAHDGRKFEDGAEWHIDDCTFCECRKGKVLCSVEDCQIPQCENPVKVPGRCCPVCLDSSCHAFNGTLISAEDVWKEGICTHCYCAGGERKCAMEKCPFVNCTEAYFPSGKCCPVCQTGVTDCMASDWTNWNGCPVQECGGGMRRRYRGVLVPHRNGGKFCPHLSEAQLCQRLPCDILPVCPVTEWTPWGACTATCGSGRRMRSRARAPSTKATMTSLIDCSKTSMQETSYCHAGACLDSPVKDGELELPIYEDNCYDVTWTDWTECSSECGVGVQGRNQVLANGSISSGHMCHLLEETRKCHRHKCHDETAVTRCKVSHWGHWGPCSKSCGSNSTRTRYRTILHDTGNGQRPCPRMYVTKRCRPKPCRQKDELYNIERCVSNDGHRLFSEGEHWLPDPCVSCRCLNSRKQCEKISCDPPDCKNSIKLPGLCCEFCPS